MTSDTDRLFDAALEVQWQSQEHALGLERDPNAPTLSNDPEHQAYRMVMRALRHPELPELPAGFSSQVARLAQAHPVPTSASDKWFERGLPWLMTLLFGGAFALTLWLTPDDVRPILDSLPWADGLAGWSVLTALALLVSRLPLPKMLGARHLR